MAAMANDKENNTSSAEVPEPLEIISEIVRRFARNSGSAGSHIEQLSKFQSLAELIYSEHGDSMTEFDGVALLHYANQCLRENLEARLTIVLNEIRKEDEKETA